MAGSKSRSKIDVLNRLLYLLEENSVVALTAKDDEFRRFIVDIYSTVNHKVDDLCEDARHDTH